MKEALTQLTHTVEALYERFALQQTLFSPHLKSVVGGELSQLTDVHTFSPCGNDSFPLCWATCRVFSRLSETQAIWNEEFSLSLGTFWTLHCNIYSLIGNFECYSSSFMSFSCFISCITVLPVLFLSSCFISPVLLYFLLHFLCLLYFLLHFFCLAVLPDSFPLSCCIS